MTPPYFVLSLIAGRTFDVKSLAEMNPLPAACGDAGNPKKIFEAGI